MDIVLLSLMTWKLSVLPSSSLKQQLMELRITVAHLEQVYHQSASRIAGYHRYDDTLHCHEATHDKNTFMYLIIICHVIISFLRKNENILMTKKTDLQYPDP